MSRLTKILQAVQAERQSAVSQECDSNSMDPTNLPSTVDHSPLPHGEEAHEETNMSNETLPVADAPPAVGDIAVATDGNSTVVESPVAVSTEGVKEVFGFITSKEKRLQWTLKQMPKWHQELVTELEDLEKQLKDAKRAQKDATVRELDVQIATLKKEIADLEEETEAFEADLAQIQAKKKGKVSQEADSSDAVSVPAVVAEEEVRADVAPAVRGAITEDTAAAEVPTVDESDDVITEEDFEELVAVETGLENLIASLEQFGEKGLNVQGLHFAVTTYNTLRERVGFEAVSVESIGHDELKASAREMLEGVQRLTYSMEGWKGALGGLIPTAILSFIPFGTAITGAVQGQMLQDRINEVERLKAQLDSLGKQINEKIVAKKPEGSARVRRAKVAIAGMAGGGYGWVLGPFYTIFAPFLGHEIEELGKEARALQKKIEAKEKEVADLLNKELKKAKKEVAKK